MLILPDPFVWCLCFLLSARAFELLCRPANNVDGVRPYSFHGGEVEVKVDVPPTLPTILLSPSLT